MSKQPPTIALLVDYLVSSYQVTLIRAVQRAVTEEGANLLVVAGRAIRAPSVGEATQSRIYELLGPANVDGILLVSGCMSSMSGAEALADYCQRYQPIPVCSIGIELPNVPSLIISNYQGSRAAVEHLIRKHGVRRVAYVAGPTGNPEAVERLAGCRDALEAAGLELGDECVEFSDFTLPGGVAATKSLVSRGLKFDAIVTANDYMALGALQVLRGFGSRVPDDVLLVGFDDSPFARFTLPSLTTVRQPLDRMARVGVEGLIRASRGTAMPLVTSIDVDVVARQSCGCGMASFHRFHTLPPDNDRDGVVAAILNHREVLLHTLHENISVPPHAFEGWGLRLLDALCAELNGTLGRFLTVLTSLLEAAQSQPDFVDELAKVIGVLRYEIRRLRPTNDVALELEQLWHIGQIAVSNAATYVQGNEKLELQVVIDAARVGFERIGTALSRPALRQAIKGMLPDLQIRNASISLFDDEKPEELVPFVTLVNGAPTQLPSELGFPSSQLVPTGFFTDERHSYVVVPLSFEHEFFGLMVLEYSTSETVYGLLRDHVSSALEGGLLHRAALNQAALLERAEREHLQQEAKIAARIQTAILPSAHHVEGLEIFARMEPAVDVGGDYFDIVPTAEGCWLGIGDVTGHGLIAGIIMLMLQGMVASMVRHTPKATPAELVVALNSSLYENIRGRLERDDHATLTLFRYERNGTVTYAGAHDDFILWRAKTGAVETMSSPGFWSGALPDVAHLTTDATLHLEDNDLLVLYTDGVAEAMNELNEQFGLERLCELVQQNAAKNVTAIGSTIINSVKQWQSRQQDDVTVLVVRYNRAVGENAVVNP